MLATSERALDDSGRGKSEGAVPAAARLPHRRRRPEAFPAREPVGLAEMNVIGDTCDDVAEG
jgi:hypothetical protein